MSRKVKPHPEGWQRPGLPRKLYGRICRMKSLENPVILSNSLSPSIKWLLEYNFFLCPNCKAQFNDEILYMIQPFEKPDKFLPYCPMCGQKMEGVEE